MTLKPPLVGSRVTRMRILAAENVEVYAPISGGRNPLHFDAAFAAQTQGDCLVVQSGLTRGLFNALAAMEPPGPAGVVLDHAWDDPAQVFIRDTVTAEARVPRPARADADHAPVRGAARRQHLGPPGERLVDTTRPDAL